MSKKLTVYFTSDTHGYLYPTDFISDKPTRQGLLSMRFPKDENTLVIDGGDTIQGSPLTYYCKTKGENAPIHDVMNAMGYDYVTLGNHDFNNGYERLAEHIRGLRAKCLCVNVEDTTCALPIFSSHVHVLGNGLRVGLVGIVTDWINRWEQPENLESFRVSPPLDAARKAVENMDCDVLIGIYHGGIERDLETGRLLSDTDENIACRLCECLSFDLLLTGHQHAALPSGTWHGTHLVQPPPNATHFIKVEMDENKRFSSALMPVNALPLSTPRLRSLYDGLTRWLDTPVARLPFPLRPQDKLSMALKGSPIADFFNLVQLDATGADLSLTALGNDIRGFNQSVTVRDVVASYVYANTLVVLRVTGKILKEALEQCAAYFTHENGRLAISEAFLRPKQAHYNYDYFMGVEYAFDLSRPVGSRVARLERRGRAVRPDDVFTLAMCNYRATGAGGFDMYLNCPRVMEGQTEISELILNYLTTHKDVSLPDHNAYTILNA